MRDDGQPHDGRHTSFVGKLLDEDDVDMLQDGVRVLAQALMETEVSSQIRATPSSAAPPERRTATVNDQPEPVSKMSRNSVKHEVVPECPG